MEYCFCFVYSFDTIPDRMADSNPGITQDDKTEIRNYK